MKPAVTLAIAASLLAAGCDRLGIGSADYETAVKRQLRDPESAQFSDVEVAEGATCGFVNSKNGYGGYAGRVPFVVRWTGTDNPDVVVMSATEVAAMPAAFDACPISAQTAVISWISTRISEDMKKYQ